MDITFGMHLDGVQWSERSAAIGTVRIGPNGFLGILETELGLSKPSIHPVHRIDAYMKRLEKLDCESAWFHESFSVDSWSVSRQLLKWRDELIEAGWTGEVMANASPRLKTLCNLEDIDIPLPAGYSYRMREVIKSLGEGFPVHIESVCLLEPESMLPPVWAEVISLLKKHGTNISVCKESIIPKDENNLSRIQGVLKSGEVESELSLEDDSVILLNADNEWEAAENLALWLSLKQKDKENLTIICGMDTTILDQCLKLHGLPCLGRAEYSKWREMQQILPLVLLNAWKPVDIRSLVELLSLTIAPFPKWVCGYLLRAISKEPGVNGRAWNKALDKIEEIQKQRLADNGDKKADENAKAFVKEIQSLLVEDRFDPVEGIPEGKLRERCEGIIGLLGWRLEKEPILKEVVSQVREMQKLSEGKVNISRLTLERMLDAVIGMGSVSGDVREEAGKWKAVDHPGQVVDSCGELVWWGFNDLGDETQTFWSDSERKALKGAGALLEEPKDMRLREANAWKRALMCSEKRFVAIYIKQMEGNEAYHHPYWDSILCAAKKTGNAPSEDSIKNCFIKECKSLSQKRDWEFAGRRTVLYEEPEVKIMPDKKEYSVTKSVMKPPERLSYSQMSTLIGCPMKWALEYHAGLRLPESQAIPSGNQMIGTLCHRIIEELYETENKIDTVDAIEKAGQLYDRLIPSMASELLLEGNSIMKQRYRTSIVEAVRQLVAAINNIGLRVEKTEAQLSAEIEGIPFIGYADLLLRDRDENTFIIDMKWSSSSKYRRQELEEGNALQLAAYAWMIRSAEPEKMVHAGYFMLAQGEMITDSNILAEEACNSPYTLEQVWSMGTSSMKKEYKRLDSGLIEVRGVMELIEARNRNIKEEKIREELKLARDMDGELYISPPCRFCDFKYLCGFSGGCYE